MPISQGSAFENRQYGNLSPHLWIVISNPHFDNERIVIVNITTWRDEATLINDESCIIEGGEHEYIDHKSYVFYRQSTVTSEDKIQLAIDGGALIVQNDCSPELLKKILNGAAESQFTQNEVKSILQSQGLID